MTGLLRKRKQQVERFIVIVDKSKVSVFISVLRLISERK